MRNDDEEVMAWLESSLEYVRNRRQARMEKLLESVQADVVLEADLAKRRGRSTRHSLRVPGSPHDSGNQAATASPERTL